MNRQKGVRRIRILEATGRPGATTNPYIRFLAEGLSSEWAQVSFFSWPIALFGRYDLMHMHWPEHLYRHKNSWIRATKSMLTMLLMLRLRTLRIPLVWTVHNRSPHEREGEFDAWMERRVIGCVSHRIYLTQADANESMCASSFTGSEYTVIPHGHYCSLFPNSLDMSSVDRRKSGMRWLLLGNLRRYKGIETLIDVFRRTSDPKWRLRISGNPESPEYAEELLGRCRGDERIDCFFGFVPEELLPDVFMSSDAMILPYPDMGNSGAAILALSAHTPVLAPSTVINRELSDDVGPGWMYLYDGSLSEEHLLKAAHSFGRLVTAPNLSARDWDRVVTAHMVTFRSLVAREVHE